MKKLFIVLFLLSVAAISFRKKQEYVNIYNWYGLLPLKLINKFEKETNIKVRYDVFDNNEVLEAKLFATNSGYDVVFPSASPYVERQIRAEIYMKLDRSLLPNRKFINSYLLEQMQKIDKEHAYCIPYIWGTTGIIYNEDIIDQIIKDPRAKNSISLLFDPKNLELIAPYGVSFLEEAIDVMPMLHRALKIPLAEQTDETLIILNEYLRKLRQFIKRFSTDRISNDLLTNEIAAGIFWSGDAYKTINNAKKIGKKLRYFIPAEGASLWIDVIAIPKGAPNPINAHKFINFCLKPENAAMITNKTFATTSIDDAKQFIDKNILSSEYLFPSTEKMCKLHLDQPLDNESYERKRLQLWTKIKKSKNGIV